jgi:vacuolar-type H+-ATPase subunit H
MSHPSELATLVETESRLDTAVASARKAAEDICAAARERARVATAQLEHALEGERARIADAITTETAAHVRAVEEHALAAIARYEAVHDEVLQRLAERLARRLLAMAQEEP